jgi:hypothetical protein
MGLCCALGATWILPTVALAEEYVIRGVLASVVGDEPALPAACDAAIRTKPGSAPS